MFSPLSATRYEPAVPLDSVRNRVLIELVVQGHRVLEMGCSTGYISKCLVERGCSVTGVEVDEQAAEQARRWCERVIVTDLNQANWVEQVGRDYDRVLFGDVLEHLVNPEAALWQTKALLKPDGRVIVCLPNIAHWRVRASLLRGKFEYTSQGILDVTHLRFFTHDTARKLVEDAGYRVVSRHSVMGGGNLGRRIRAFFPGLFTLQMVLVAEPVLR